MISRISDRVSIIVNKVFAGKVEEGATLEWELTSAVSSQLSFENGLPTVNSEHIMVLVLILSEPGNDPLGMTCAFGLGQLTDDHIEDALVRLSDEITVSKMAKSFYSDDPEENVTE